MTRIEHLCLHGLGLRLVNNVHYIHSTSFFCFCIVSGRFIFTIKAPSSVPARGSHSGTLRDGQLVSGRYIAKYFNQDGRRLTSRDQRRRVHDAVDGPQVLRGEGLGHSQVHVGRPRVDDGIGVLAQVDGLFLLGGQLRVALQAQGGAELAEREPVLDVALEVAVDLEQFVCQPSVS